MVKTSGQGLHTLNEQLLSLYLEGGFRILLHPRCDPM